MWDFQTDPGSGPPHWPPPLPWAQGPPPWFPHRPLPFPGLRALHPGPRTGSRRAPPSAGPPPEPVLWTRPASSGLHVAASPGHRRRRQGRTRSLRTAERAQGLPCWSRPAPVSEDPQGARCLPGLGDGRPAGLRPEAAQRRAQDAGTAGPFPPAGSHPTGSPASARPVPRAAPTRTFRLLRSRYSRARLLPPPPLHPRAPASDSAAPVSELWAVAHGQQLSFEAPACPQKRPWGPADQCPSPQPARPELQGPSARCPHPLAPAPGEGAARLTLCQLRLWDSRGSCSCAWEPPPSPSSRASRAGRQPSPILATSAARLDAALKCPACQPCCGRQLTTAVSQPGGPTEGSWALPPPCRQGQPHPWPSEPAWDTPEDRGVKDPEVTSWASGHRVSPGAMQLAGRLLVLLS